MILPINFDEGKYIQLPMSAGGSTGTYTVGEMLKISSGYYTAATVGQNTDIEAVCMENKTISADGQLCLCIPTRGVRFLADTNGEPTIASYQGTYCDIYDANTLDEDASDDDIFYIEKVVGPVANKKVQGFFQHGTPLA